MIVTDQMLIDRVDEFLRLTGMSPTRLGVDALSDGGLVRGLRAGRSLTLKSAERLVRFMDQHEADLAGKEAA